MNFLRAVCRLLAGIAFIVSGYFKAVDPIGVILKIKEYFHAFHIDFIDFAATPLALFLCAAEFVIGVAVLKGIKMKWFTRFALWFISFFTFITAINLIFNLVQDCGCFGEIIHFTNFQTLLKNVVLLFAILFIYFDRDKFLPIATPKWEWIYLLFYFLFIFFIEIYSLIYNPILDFGTYKVGTDLNSLTGEAPMHDYEAVFIYEKEGIQKEFSLDNLPDSTWKYVDTKTELLNADSIASETANFVLKNDAGEYITSQILESETPTFFLSFYNVDKIGEKTIQKIISLNDSISVNGGVLYGLSGNSVEETQIVANKLPFNFLYSDYKTVLSFNRINGGLTYVNNGIIVMKRGRNEYKPTKINKLISNDPQIIAAESVIKEKLFMEISLLFILSLIGVLRFVSKRMYLK